MGYTLYYHPSNMEVDGMALCLSKTVFRIPKTW